MKSKKLISDDSSIGFSETVFCTVFGIGFIPFFPGTIGSLAGLLCYV